MPKYKALPPPEFLLVHGVFSLGRGWYKTGDVSEKPTETDIVLEVDRYDVVIWYQNGKIHREGGPAVQRADGYGAWYHKGERHREDGPAIEDADGSREWYLNGKRLYITTLEELQTILKQQKGG